MSAAQHLFSTVITGASLGPHMPAVLGEAWRLTKKWGCRLVVVHVAKKDEEGLEDRVHEAVSDALPETEVLTEHTEPNPECPSVLLDVRYGRASDELLRATFDHAADVLILGAYRHESLIKRWVGSASRKLARRAPCSVLLLPVIKEEPATFERIVVGVDESDESELALAAGAMLARLEPAEKLTAVWEYSVPGFAAAMSEGGSAEETKNVREEMQASEERKLDNFLKTADLFSIPVDAVCLFGEPGYVVSEYAREHNADLLVIPAPDDHTGIDFRLFPHDEEMVLQNMPCEVLLVRRKRSRRSRKK